MRNKAPQRNISSSRPAAGLSPSNQLRARPLVHSLGRVARPRTRRRRSRRQVWDGTRSATKTAEGEVLMAGLETKSLDAPDETRPFEKGWA